MGGCQREEQESMFSKKRKQKQNHNLQKDEKAKKKKVKKRRRKKTIDDYTVQNLIIDTAFKLFLIGGLVYVVFTFFFGFYVIPDDTMYPLYHKGDIVIVDRKSRTPMQAEVIQINMKGKNQIRRVIAAEGDNVSINKDGVIKVNDAGLIEDIPYKTYPNGSENYPVYIYHGHYYVLADNRENAKGEDSRGYGLISSENIKGKVIGVLFRKYF